MTSSKTRNQTNLNIFYNFNISDSFENSPKSLTTSTRGTNFTFNPSYSCRCRRGYSLFSDPFNAWKMTEDQAIHSRAREKIDISIRAITEQGVTA